MTGFGTDNSIIITDFDLSQCFQVITVLLLLTVFHTLYQGVY